MHTVHAGLSIAVNIQPGKADSVKSFLSDLNRNPGGNGLIPFSKSPTTLFVSGVVLPEQDYNGKKLPETCLFMTSYTGPRKIHLQELISIGAPGLRQLFQYCVGFPATALHSDKELTLFLKRHAHADTFYTGMQYITSPDIAKEEQLRASIEDYLDQMQTNDGFNRLDEKAIRSKIQDFVKSKPEFSWTAEIPKRSFMDYWLLYRGIFFLALIILLVLLSVIGWLVSDIAFYRNTTIFSGILLSILAVLLINIRLLETKSQFVAGRQPDKWVKAIYATQIHPVLNQMTVSGPLKKGNARIIVYYLLLKLVSILRGTITIPTIATARWLTIDGGKRLVFISNYSNVSESYVRDFIDSKQSASKINLLFGQGYGYPATQWIMGKGAIDDPDGFIDEVFLMQHITQLWYWPYQNLSVDNINISHQIRTGLFATLTGKEIKEWLALL
jgi:hypothetical protein